MISHFLLYRSHFKLIDSYPTFSAQLKYPLIVKPAQTSRQKCLMSSGHIVLVPTITVKSILDSHQLLECQVYSIRKQLGTKRD